MKGIALNIARRIVNFLSKRVKQPRYWTIEEWQRFTPEEKVWIWYKSFFFIKGLGSAEFDNITMPIRDLIGLVLLIQANLMLYFVSAGIQVNYFVVFMTTLGICALLYIGNTVFQWFFGEFLDKRDLHALSQRVSEKRSMVSRKIMGERFDQKWRKGKVN